jgi:methionyl-tRNA formyltransferase
MRLVVLTTDTLHHAYFVREIARAWPIQRVMLETRAPAPPFPTAHPFEAAREEHERRAWFAGGAAGVDRFAETETWESCNDPAAVAELARLAPDAVVVYGTGRLAPPVIAVAPDGIVNLHGGDPERYRGLDSHLWAIHGGEFDALSVALHRVAPALDAGDIVDLEPLALRRGMGLHELRRATAETCVRMAAAALQGLARTGRFACRPQRRKGAYYSFMPAALKEGCVRRFAAHTRELP